jgi:hypothetical protein
MKAIRLRRKDSIAEVSKANKPPQWTLVYSHTIAIRSKTEASGKPIRPYKRGFGQKLSKIDFPLVIHIRVDPCHVVLYLVEQPNSYIIFYYLVINVNLQKKKHVTKGCDSLSVWLLGSKLSSWFDFYPLCFIPLVRSPHLIFLFLILSLLCPIRSHLRFSFYLPILYHLQKLITIDNILHHFFLFVFSLVVSCET